jgi:hypothetical protein
LAAAAGSTVGDVDRMAIAAAAPTFIRATEVVEAAEGATAAEVGVMPPVAAGVGDLA